MGTKNSKDFMFSDTASQVVLKEFLGIPEASQTRMWTGDYDLGWLDSSKHPKLNMSTFGECLDQLSFNLYSQKIERRTEVKVLGKQINRTFFKISLSGWGYCLRLSQQYEKTKL